MENPKIRFKGYTKDWEQRKFGKITELKSASRVHKDEWTSNGVPFYRSSDVMAAINGTENEKAFISEELYEKLSKVSGKLEEGDILVTGGGSVGNPYIVPDNKPLYTKDADLLWIKNKGKFHPYFLYEFFFSPTFRNYLESISHVGTIAHYTITQLSETPICLPSFEEQKEVGEYFQNLDHLITLHQRKCEQTKKLKKYMLQKMFPRNGAKVPEIRFDGFTYDWEQRKLGDVCSRVQGNDGRMKLPTLTISAGNGWMRQEDRFSGNIAGNEQKNYTLLHTGELSYNHGNSKLAKYGAVFSLRNYEEALVPRVYHSFRVEEGCADYIEYYFATKLPDRELRKLISSGARMDGLLNIGYDEFMGIKMMFPSIKEQNEIATYFRSIDHLITLHQRKCDELKKMKKYMLQNMFI